jgi:hypothetical protein
MIEFDRHKPTPEDRVFWAKDSEDRLERDVAAAEDHVGRSFWQWTGGGIILTTISGLITVGAAAVAIISAGGEDSDSIGHNAIGVIIFALFFVTLGVVAICEARSDRAYAPEHLARRESALAEATLKRIDAESSVAFAQAEAQRIREMPAALHQITEIISSSSRDWSGSDEDSSLYAIAVGLSGRGGPHSDLANARGWTPTRVADLTASHNAYLHATQQEASRRTR